MQNEMDWMEWHVLCIQKKQKLQNDNRIQEWPSDCTENKAVKRECQCNICYVPCSAQRNSNSACKSGQCQMPTVNANTNNNKRTHCLCLIFFPFSLVWESWVHHREIERWLCFWGKNFFFLHNNNQTFHIHSCIFFFPLLFFLISSCIWGKNFDIRTIKPFAFIAHAHHIHVHACIFFSFCLPNIFFIYILEKVVQSIRYYLMFMRKWIRENRKRSLFALFFLSFLLFQWFF